MCGTCYAFGATYAGVSGGVAGSIEGNEDGVSTGCATESNLVEILLSNG